MLTQAVMLLVSSVPDTCTTACHSELSSVSDSRHARFGCVDCHVNVKDGQADHAGALDELTCGTAGCHPQTAKAMLKGRHKDSTCDSCHGALHDDFKPKNWKQCASCHKDEALAFESSVHQRAAEPATCGDCHGDVHDVQLHLDPLAPTSKVMQVTTCGECHDSEYVRAFRSSVHGQGLLRSGLSVAPACTDCHGAHDIKKTKDVASKVSHDNITATCGKCHAFITARWKNSTHGELASKQAAVDSAVDGGVAARVLGPRKTGREGPVCSSCHTGHRTFDPTIYGNHLKMADKCGECHPAQAASYRDSFHGKATRLGFTVAATCADCHTPHEMLPEDSPKSSVHPKNLKKTCGRCHEGATDSFVGFAPHMDPTVPGKPAAVHVVWAFMTYLLFGVLGFFGVHTLLWLQRSIVALVRHEVPHPVPGTQWVRRFRPLHRSVHLAVVVTFLLLAATGLPIKLSYLLGWAEPVAHLFGGLGLARWVHRLAGLATFTYGVVYVGWLAREVVARRRRELLWGWQSMVPGWRDAKDLLSNLKYFLYLGERPKLDRWAYWEKFDFFAVAWGIPVIGLSGLMLWFPRFTTELFPGWVLNVAYLIHSDEALLATGFIFFFHFFHTHLRPEAFPLDPVIFLGSMPLERFKDERPNEYARLEATGELAALIEPAPGLRAMRRAYRIGFTALAIGVLLGAFLLIAGFAAVWH